MQSETKTHSTSSVQACQNCKQDFVIEPDDFLFYEKIKVPPPTFCPECRQVRRMMWRNERGLHTRKCDALGHEEKIVSVFSQDTPLKVYDQRYWWGDAWDPMDYGRDYDFSKTFFEQFKNLFQSTPQLALSNPHAVNTEYAQHTFHVKNGYLVSALANSENAMYANKGFGIKDSMDIYLAGELELSYESVNAGTSYKLFFSYGCEDCRNVWFSYDCRGCSDCFGCVGLRNKQYYIFNKPYAKDEYFKKINEFDTGSYKVIEELKQQRGKLILTFPRKYIYSVKVVDTTGDNIIYSKNCHSCFDSDHLENCKFIAWGLLGGRDSYDNYGMGAGCELSYENVFLGEKSSQIKFSSIILNSHNIQYSYNCHSSNNLFGCIGLRNKSYGILNKQYTKEGYEELIPKIIQHMNKMPYEDEKGMVYQYGEFFPINLCPYSYNETVAQEYATLTKQEAEVKGYNWKKPEERSYQVDIKSEDLPDHIKNIDESILGRVIECVHKGNCNEQCTTAFKIIKEEIQFYKKMNLPLPRLCPNCRHYQRLRQRNPLKLWHRKCMCDYKIYKNETIHRHHTEGQCPNTFETSYAPDRPEIIYCEQCYNAEVV